MRAKKRFGQNFLHDPGVVAAIVDALELREGDRVVEIGPGEGALTGHILGRRAELVSIEIDRDLAGMLRKRFGSEKRFRLIEGDVLSIDLASVFETDAEPSKVIGNLPYYISTPIVERLIDARLNLERVVVMLQKEVVERLTAPAGNSDRGYFTILVENAFETESLMIVPPTAFRPAPAVYSAVIRMVPKERLIEDTPPFRSLLSAAFAQKRKTLLNNLRNVNPAARDVLESVGIDGQRRAETLSLPEWKLLNDAFADSFEADEVDVRDA